ncbi:MAG: type II toxin-antitoxin system PemK/MazF family toxin [Pseudomonadota bacterium]
MSPFAQWDIVILPFPYADKLAEKRRPGLVISGDTLFDDHGLLWVAMITSAKNADRPGDIPIQNLKSAGLPVASLIRPSKVATIEPARVLRRAGALPPKQQEQVGRALRLYLESA